MLVRHMCLLLDLEGSWALAVPGRMGSSTVYAHLLSVELGTAGFALGVRRSCAVAAPALILAESANMAELVAVKAPADSKVRRVGLTVKDLGLPDKSTFTQAGRRVYTT